MILPVKRQLTPPAHAHRYSYYALSSIGYRFNILKVRCTSARARASR
jgi:hypothetical protein